jgi:hypothetical protein
MCPDSHTSEAGALAAEAVLPANLVVVRNWGYWGAAIVVAAAVDQVGRREPDGRDSNRGIRGRHLRPASFLPCGASVVHAIY